MKALTQEVLTVVLLIGLTASTRAAVYQETGGRVTVEAEHFHARTTRAVSGHHWHIVPDDDGIDPLADVGDPPHLNARGEKYMQNLPDNGFNFAGNNGTASIVGQDPYMDYKVLITTTGRYQLYLRWAGHSGGTDSMYGQIVELADGVGGALADWYRYGGVNQIDFGVSGWRGTARPEGNDAGGGEVAATWQIDAPGLYTIRLSHREDGVTVDALVLQLANMPAPANTAPTFGPPESPITTAFPPFVRSISPGNAATGVFPDATFRIEIEDGGSAQVKADTIELTLNGNVVASSSSKAGNVTTVTASPASLFPAGSVNSATIKFSDTSGNSFTKDWQFTVERYATLTADLARPAGTVDTATSGFTVTVHQARTDGDSFTLPNDTRRAESQLRGLLIDPTINAPYVNHAIPGTGAGGTHTDADVINWDQVQVDRGNFTAANGFPEEPIPGIPGDEGSNNNIAAELITFLDLPAGLIRLGVNSDDGFRVTSAVNPRDATALELGVFSGGRGAADTIFSVFVEEAGIYPIRLIWYEGNGDANLEFFAVNLATGAKTLINDRSNASHIKAYRVSTLPLLPIVDRALPAPGSANVNAGSQIDVLLRDQNSQVDATTVVLTVNGAVVPASVVKTGDRTQITYDPPGLMASGSTQTINVSFKDNAATPNTVTRSWSFAVQDFSALPVLTPEMKVSGVDTTKPGFLIKLRQMEVARPGANNLPAPLIQLDDGFINAATGQPYDDQIDRSQTGFEPGSGFNANGTFTEAGVINYNQNALGVGGEEGVFRAPTFPDKPIPGIPGLLGSTDNIAMFASTILELKTGVYRFAVNSDDGFIVSSEDARDIFGRRLGLFDGGRGQATSTFEFVVQEDGFYPFQLVWWEGNGGAEVEFFSVDTTTGDQTLINHRQNANAIKAYRPASVDPARPFVRSVKPGINETVVPKSTTIEAVIVDGIATVVPASIQLKVDGSAVAATTSKTGNATTIAFDPPGDLASLSTHQVELTFSDNAANPRTRTLNWSFQVESAAPKVLFVVGSTTINGSEAQIKARLESKGFEVQVWDDDSALPSNVNFKQLIIVCSTSGSGNITKYRNVPVPIINWEWAAYDGLAMSDADGVALSTENQTKIVNASHPLAAGLSGTVTLFPAPAAQMAVVTPVATATMVSTTIDDLNGAIFAFDTGQDMAIDATTGAAFKAPARRVGFPLGGDTFASMTADGLKLFDAAVEWAANLPKLPPQITIVRRAGGSLTIEWTGGGTLETTDKIIGGSWTNSGLTSPASIPESQLGTIVFARVRR